MLVFVFSIMCECTQYSIGRICDIDDVILNTIGGVIGWLIF